MRKAFLRTSNALGRARIETQDNKTSKKVDLSIQEDASVYPALVEQSFSCVLTIFLHHFYFPREYETQEVRGNKTVNKNVSRVDSKSVRVNCDSQLRVYDNSLGSKENLAHELQSGSTS